MSRGQAQPAATEVRPGGQPIALAETERRRLAKSFVDAQRASGIVTRVLPRAEFEQRQRAAGVRYEQRAPKNMSPSVPPELVEYARLARGAKARRAALAAVARWHVVHG